MWNLFPVLDPKICIFMLRLWASVLETGSATKSQFKIPRQGGSQSDWQLIKTEIPERDYLILMKPGSISAQRFHNVSSSLPAYLLGSWATQQGSKYLDFRCFSLLSRTTTTRDVRLQKSQDVQFLGSSVAWSLQNRSPSSLAPQCTGNSQGMGFLGSCFIVRACLLTSWWTFRRLDIPKPAIPHSDFANTVRASMLLCSHYLTTREYVTFRKPDCTNPKVPC